MPEDSEPTLAVGADTGTEMDSLLAIPQLTADGHPFVEFVWGDRQVAVNPDAARQIGLIVLEAAEQAETEALMFAWMAAEPTATTEGVSKIIGSFRRFRASAFAEAAEPEATA